jgi:hypothetical protein
MAAPATPSAFYAMLSIPEAQETILAETAPLPAEEVPFQQALHRTLAEDVLAAEPVPGFRASIKASHRPPAGKWGLLRHAGEMVSPHTSRAICL